MRTSEYATRKRRRPVPVESPARLVLFDLDDTLVATGWLEELRHRGDDVDLLPIFARERLAPYEGVQDAVGELAEVVPIGLVTSSARWYASQVLEWCFPGTTFSPFVTFDDVLQLKPAPEPLERALERAGVRADETRYVGNDHRDAEACRASGIPFVGAGWSCSRTYPEAGIVECLRPADLLSVIVDGGAG